MMTEALLGGGNIRGNSDFDVSVLQIDLDVPPVANCLTFDFQFYSEEFPEFVTSNFNDAFIAELDVSNWTTAGSVITAPNNFAFDPFGPPGGVISIKTSGVNSMNAANAAGTTYDGATPLLSASTQITPGSHALFLSIFDQADQRYDSAVFVDNLVVGFVPNPTLNCVAGATPKTFALSLDPAEADNPEGTDHTVTATLLEEGAPLPNADIDFEASGANAASSTGVTDVDGQAAFTYTGFVAGSDVITACYDVDNDGTCEAVASAQKTWLHVNAPPVALCQDVTVDTDPGVCFATSADVNNGSFDPDPGDSITLNQTPAGPYSIGPTPVTLTATDTENATNSGAATVLVVDSIGPTVSCEESTNPSLKNTPRSKNPDGFFVVGAADICGPPEITLGTFALTAGETIKITQTRGRSGVRLVNTMGQGGIRHFQVGPGDAVITATDGAGNATSVTCLVPPPPK